MSADPIDPELAGESGGIHETTYKKPASREEAPATAVSGVAVQNVEAETVMMDRSSSQTVNGSRVVMEKSSAKSIEANSTQIDKSGIVSVDSDNAVLLRSKAVQIVAEEARINRSRAFYISARNAEIENSQIVLFAGHASGEVKTLFTPVTAAIAGAGLGFVLVVVSALIRSVFGRD